MKEPLFFVALQTLASSIDKEDIKVGRIYPHINRMLSISQDIAANIVSLACDQSRCFEKKYIFLILEIHKVSVYVIGISYWKIFSQI